MNRHYILFLIAIFAASLSAQPDRNQKFAGAAYVGGNFTQIHGDSYFGYNNMGVRFGIETQYLLKPKYFVSLGIGFSQEGALPSQKEVDEGGGIATALKLSMVEIPLLFNYRLGDEKAKGKRYNHALYRSTILQGGVRLTRLVNNRTVNRGYFNQGLPDPAFTEAEIEFQDFDFAFIGGANFQLGLKYSVFVQHSLSFRGLYRRDDLELVKDGPYMVSQLRPYSLTIGGKITLY